MVRASSGGKNGRRCPLMQDRAVYGDPLLMPGMAHAPTNEAGVMFAFCVLARERGGEDGIWRLVAGNFRKTGLHPTQRKFPKWEK
jgi:hypothetical protein